MNKFIFMIALTTGGCLGGLARGPFIPLAVYYFYAVLRPQYLWQWQLLAYPDIGWSFYVAGAAILTFIPWGLGVIGPHDDPDRRVFPRFVVPHRMMALFALWATLSYGYSNNQDVAWVYYQELLKIFAMYFVATQVVRSLRQVWVLYLVVTIALGYLAVDINQLYLTTGYLLLVKRGFAGLDNNGAGLMLAMGIPLAYFAWEATRGWYRWGYLLVIPAVLHVVVSSYSRGAMLSALLVVPLYLVYSRKRHFLAVVLVGIAALIPVMAGQEIRARFLSIDKAEVDDSFNSRLASWTAAVRIANDYPIFGAGVRCSNLLTKQYGADMEGRAVHSQYLQLAADNGWIGMLIYVGCLGTTMASIWRARRRLSRSTDPESVRTVAMLGGIECSLWTFIVGATALSMETFEMSYLLMFLGAQVWAIQNARVAPRASAKPPAGSQPAPAPPPPEPGPGDPQTPLPGRVPVPTRADVHLPTLPDVPPPPGGWSSQP